MQRFSWSALAVLLIAVAPLAALTPATDIVVPAGARGAGAGTSVWQMDLYIVNTSPLTANIEIYWLPRDQNNSGAEPFMMTIPAGQEAVLEDVIQSLVGLSSAGGAFRVVSDMPVAVNSRIYNLQGSTTFGQGFEGLTTANKMSAGGTTTAWIPGLQQSAASRSNLFAVADGSGASFTVNARTPMGDALGSSSYTVPPWGAFFAPLTETVSGQPGDVVVQITIDSGGAWFAGSRVDESSGDPFTLAAAVANTQQFEATDFEGTYTGSWENTTFGSSGGASVEIAVDTAAETIDFTLDLDGSVFGSSDPPAEMFSGGYDVHGFAVSGTSQTFGSLSITVNALGDLVGIGTDVPNPSIDRVELSGSAQPEAISIDYTVYFAGGGEPAVGVINVTK
jgi:hypothetical protein